MSNEKSNGYGHVDGLNDNIPYPSSIEEELFPGETMEGLYEDYANEEYKPEGVIRFEKMMQEEEKQKEEENRKHPTLGYFSSLSDRDFKEVQNIISAYQVNQDLRTFKGICHQMVSLAKKTGVPNNEAFLHTADGYPFVTLCVPGSQKNNTSGHDFATGTDAQLTIYNYLKVQKIPVWYLIDTGINPPDLYITMAFHPEDIERCGGKVHTVRGGKKYTFPGNARVPVMMTMNVSPIEHIKYQHLLATNKADMERYERDKKAQQQYGKYKEKQMRDLER